MIIKCLIELPVCDSTAVRTVVVTIVPDPQVLYFQRPRAHRRHAGLAFFGAPHARGCCGQHRCTSSNGWRKWCGVLRHTSPWVRSGQNCTNLINTLACPTGPRGMGINSHVPADCDQALRLQSQLRFQSSRVQSQEFSTQNREDKVCTQLSLEKASFCLTPQVKEPNQHSAVTQYQCPRKD